jgi:hypothetical protein
MHVTVLWGNPSSTRQTVVWYSGSSEESNPNDELHSRNNAQPVRSQTHTFPDIRQFEKMPQKTTATGLAGNF